MWNSINKFLKNQNVTVTSASNTKIMTKYVRFLNESFKTRYTCPSETFPWRHTPRTRPFSTLGVPRLKLSSKRTEISSNQHGLSNAQSLVYFWIMDEDNLGMVIFMAFWSRRCHFSIFELKIRRLLCSVQRPKGRKWKLGDEIFPTR